VQCPHCDLFGHVNKKDCKYKHCINVEVDWLNILLSVSASHTITELFKASECTVDPNSLRSGGKFRKFADCQWEHVKQTCDSIGAQQLHTIIIGIRDSHPPATHLTVRGDERRLASAPERAVPSHGHIEHQLN
jgi:hypothetical protein